MKWIILAAAVSMSGAAIAQDAPPQTAPAQPPVAEQPVTTVTTTTDATGAPVTVIDEARPGNYTPPPPPDPASSYPLCSRTVTDHCRQRGG